MNITCTFKNFEPSDHLKEYANSRFGKVTKFVQESDVSELQVNLLVDKFRHKADVIFNAPNMHVSAYEESEDMYSTIDMVLDKLEAQLRKMREKMKDHRKRESRNVRMDVIQFEGEEAGGDATIVESDSYEPKPMSVEEAAMQLDTRNLEFLVFQNSEINSINVIYRRRNGAYGLIDPGN